MWTTLASFKEIVMSCCEMPTNFICSGSTSPHNSIWGFLWIYLITSCPLILQFIYLEIIWLSKKNRLSYRLEYLYEDMWNCKECPLEKVKVKCVWNSLEKVIFSRTCIGFELSCAKTGCLYFCDYRTSQTVFGLGLGIWNITCEVNRMPYRKKALLPPSMSLFCRLFLVG